MTDAQKLAFGFFALAGCSLALTVVGFLQEREIQKLKKENAAFRKVLMTRPGIELVKAVLEKAEIDALVAKVTIPDTTAGL